MVLLGTFGLPAGCTVSETVLGFSDQQLLLAQTLIDPTLSDTRVRCNIMHSRSASKLTQYITNATLHQVSAGLRQDSLLSSNTATCVHCPAENNQRNPRNRDTLEVDTVWADLMADELFVQALQNTVPLLNNDTSDEDWQHQTSGSYTSHSEASARLTLPDDAPQSYMPVLSNVPPPPPMSPPPPTDDAPRSRVQAIARYLEKKARRVHTKRIRYQMRKLNADRRPRVKGRFVKREEAAAMRAAGLL